MKTAVLLRNYQRFFSDEIVRLPAVMLAVGMSLGKTGAVLHATRRLLDRGDIGKVLVVAPLRVAKLVWPEQIEEWDFSAALSYRVIEGNPQERLLQIKELPDITIINRENIPWLVGAYKGKPWPFDMIIYDECSRMKSGKKRTAGRGMSEFGALCSIRKYVHKVVEMSGTPAPNGLIDMWGPVYFLDLGKRLGISMKSFKDRWFDSDYMGYNVTPKANAEREITSAVKDIVLGLGSGDYVELPPVIHSNHEVVLPPKMLKQYKAFERSQVSEAYDVEAVNRAVLTGKLLQFSNGSMYRNHEDGSRETVEIHDEKLRALDSIITENAGQNILVAYSFKFDKEKIKKKYPHAVVFDEDPKAYEKWKRGEIRLLLAHPASIGHGLNMQTGGHWLVWYGLTWSLELYLQMNMRLPRPGQPSPVVFIRHIICKGTQDEDVLEMMNLRGATQDSINDKIRINIQKLDRDSTFK